MPPDRIAPAADALTATLHTEVEALSTLEALYDRQLQAVRADNMGPVGEHTTKIQEQTATLQDLSARSERQVHLLGRVLEMDADEPSLEEVLHVLCDGAAPELGEQLREAQRAVTERAHDVNQRRETLRLALEYAADLNHELLTAMQAADEDPEVQTYTAEGQSEPPLPDRFFVDATG